MGKKKRYGYGPYADKKSRKANIEPNQTVAQKTRASEAPAPACTFELKVVGCLVGPAGVDFAEWVGWS